jgi:hypothetical protein
MAAPHGWRVTVRPADPGVFPGGAGAAFCQPGTAIALGEQNLDFACELADSFAAIALAVRPQGGAGEQKVGKSA